LVTLAVICAVLRRNPSSSFHGRIGSPPKRYGMKGGGMETEQPEQGGQEEQEEKAPEEAGEEAAESGESEASDEEEQA
jgi:hypothetical protein